MCVVWGWGWRVRGSHRQTDRQTHRESHMHTQFKMVSIRSEKSMDIMHFTIVTHTHTLLTCTP